MAIEREERRSVPWALDHAGGALPLVLLLVLALTVLGHAAFLVSLEEEAASRASAAVLQARVMTEGGVRRALLGVQGDSLPNAGAGAAVLADWWSAEGAYRVDARRISREVYWVEGAGRAAVRPGGPERVRDRAARLLWSLSPIERLARTRAAVEHGGLLLASGGVEASELADLGELRAPAGCLDRRFAIDSILSEGRPAASAGSVTRLGKPLPELGLLGHDTLLARVVERVDGAVTPTPTVVEGRCETSLPDNWGSPTDPSGPCGGHRRAVAAEGDLTLVGGEGQGLLLVVGDLRLTAGARHDGFVLVGGTLTVEGASILRGVVRVRGDVRVAGGSGVSGALCPALLALESVPVLRRPIHLPGGGWIRPF